MTELRKTSLLLCLTVCTLASAQPRTLTLADWRENSQLDQIIKATGFDKIVQE